MASNSVGMFQRPVEYRVNNFCFSFALNTTEIIKYDETITVNIVKKDDDGSYNNLSRGIVFPLYNIFDSFPVILWQDVEKIASRDNNYYNIKYVEYVSIAGGIVCVNFENDNISFNIVSLNSFYNSQVYYTKIADSNDYSIDRPILSIFSKQYMFEKIISYVMENLIEKPIKNIYLINDERSIFEHDLATDYNKTDPYDSEKKYDSIVIRNLSNDIEVIDIVNHSTPTEEFQTVRFFY